MIERGRRSVDMNSKCDGTNYSPSLLVVDPC